MELLVKDQECIINTEVHQFAEVVTQNVRS